MKKLIACIIVLLFLVFFSYSTFADESKNELRWEEFRPDVEEAFSEDAH